jgi:hypothetical protein
MINAYRPEHGPVLHGYGTFMVQWSIYLTVLEVAVTLLSGERITGGKALHAGTTYDGLKNACRKKLHKRAGQNDDVAIALIEEIDEDANRDLLVHGYTLIEGTSIKFSQRHRPGWQKTQDEVFSAARMKETVLALSKKVATLQKLLSIPDELIHEYIIGVRPT